jgi:hypothetical protein
MKKDVNIVKELSKFTDPFKRKLYFIGYLTKLLEKENLRPVIVGGYAVEFYTAGGYNTADIDLVFPDNKLLDKYLRGLNFVRLGRGWFNEQLDILVEAPGSSLDQDEAKNLVQVKIKNLTVYIIGIDDIIIDRLNAFVYWDSKEDGYWVKELLGLFPDKVNWKYLNRKVNEKKALKALKKLWVGSRVKPGMTR